LLPLQKQWDIADAERQKKDLQLVVKQHITVINDINDKIKLHNTQRRYTKSTVYCQFGGFISSNGVLFVFSSF
jgi:hypothetical protein